MTIKNESKLMRLCELYYFGRMPSGLPRWKFTLLDEDGQLLELKTKPELASYWACQPRHHIGKVLQVTNYVTPTSRKVVTAWQAGDFEEVFAALRERSCLRSYLIGKSSTVDKAIRL